MRHIGLLALALIVAVTVAGRAHAEWLAEVPISETTTDSESGLNHTPLTYDSQGGLTVLWAERNTPGGNYQIYARRRAWATFAPPMLVVPYPDPQPGSLLGAKFPSVAAQGDSLIVAWHDYRHGGIRNSEIYARALALDGGLGGELRLTTTMNTANQGDNGYVPVVAISEAGVVHVLWYDFRWDPGNADIFHKRRQGSGWVTPLGDSSDVNVSRAVTAGFSAGAPAIACGASEIVHAIWAELGPGGIARVRHARFDPQSGWTVPETVASPGSTVDAPTAVIDSQGVLHVVWVDGRHPQHTLYTRSLPPGGGWGAELLLTNPAVDAGEPCLTATSDGALHLVWHDTRVALTNREIFYRRRAPGAPWDVTGTSDVRISDAPGRSDRPSIAADPELNIAVLWRDGRGGQNDLFLREFRPTGPIGVGDPTLAPIAAGELISGPNPFWTEIRLAGPPRETVRILDVTGRTMVLLSPVATAWDGRDRDGRSVPAGVYFLRGLETGRAARIVRLP